MLSQFAKAIGVGAVRRPDDENDIHQLRQRLDRVLAILGGIANIFLMRPFDIGKPLMQGIDDVSAFIDAQRGLGHIGQVLRLFRHAAFPHPPPRTPNEIYPESGPTSRLLPDGRHGR